MPMKPAAPVTRTDSPTHVPSQCSGEVVTTCMDRVVAQAAALRDWLFDRALPLWWEVGADRVRGGFHEAIDLDGKPLARPHRARTIARQAFSYCEAGALGWSGPWREAARHALDYFQAHFVSADDTVVSVVALA